MAGKSNHIKAGIADRVTQVMIYIFVGGFALTTVLPFIYILAGSFATERELTERAFFLIPREFSMNAYKYIMETGEIFTGLRNSLFMTLLGTSINMFFTTTFAYPLARTNMKGKNFILNLVIVTMLFSGGMIPTYILMGSLDLKDSYLGLALLGAISPFNMIIVKNFFQELPKELEDAAQIDGCNDLKIFLKIVLPLSKPVIASVALFYAVGHWNDYFNAMIYLKPDKETVQIVLRRIIILAQGIRTDVMDFDIMGAPPDKAVKMAATVVATVPILCVYPFIQKYFAKGVMIGAVKG